MSIYEMILTLKNEPKTNAKLKLLKSYVEDCSLLERVFYMALSTELQYGIKKIPEYTPANMPVMTLGEALDILEYRFSTNTVTGNTRIEELKRILESVSKDDAKVLELVIKKNPDCGISIKNANKALKTPIPQFSVMLCSKNDEKTRSNISFPAIAQVKSDGMRIIVSIDSNGTVKYRSRNGKEMDLYHLTGTLSNYKNIVIDGEAVVFDKDGTILDRKTGNGILNSIRQGKASEEQVNSVGLLVWDLIGYNDFFSGKSEKPYKQRLNDLKKYVNLFGINNIKVIDTKIVPDYSTAIKYYNECREKGEEGIIIKDIHSPYECKRVKYQIKMKAEETADLKIIDVQEGTGKYKGMLGALICETEDGLLKVSVGSGFTEEDRKVLWNEKNSLQGKITEIKYNEIINNKGSNKKSLFLPVFVGLRTDKDKANTLDELK